jgi:hypothetical protein
MKIPVLFIIFNRPEFTQKVFDKIKEYKPERLFIVADGPRKYKDSDIILCKETRKIIEQIDWQCELKTLFRDNNLGCKISVSDGITWFFKQVNFGIILEDDCLPNSSFFKYCNHYLNVYQYNKKIFSISGSRFNSVNQESNFLLGKYGLMWGWATWADRWNQYNIDAIDYEAVLKKTFKNRATLFNYWNAVFFRLINEKIDTWDYQWILTIFRESAYVVRPSYNLVENLGFNNNSTHTNDLNHPVAKLKSFEIKDYFPNNLVYDVNIDYEDEKIWLQLDLKNKFIWRFRNTIRIAGNILRIFKMYK